MTEWALFCYIFVMIFSLFLPLLIGATGVLQNTLNRKIAAGIGLPLALLVNSFTLVLLSVALFFCLRLVPNENLPEIFRSRTEWSLGWKNLLPGFFGFFIIATAPLAIGRVGATKVFIGVIVAQIIASILWDFYAEALPISSTRLIGAALALAGALLAVR